MNEKPANQATDNEKVTWGKCYVKFSCSIDIFYVVKTLIWAIKWKVVYFSNFYCTLWCSFMIFFVYLVVDDSSLSHVAAVKTEAADTVSARQH